MLTKNKILTMKLLKEYTIDEVLILEMQKIVKY